MKLIKKCEFCKEDFEAVQKTQKFCKREHTSECEFCHKKFIVKRLASYPRTCSRQCRSKLAIKEKMENTKEMKNCELCGEEFKPLNKSQIFCRKKHFKNCEVCGKKFEVQTRKVTARTCSQSCGSALSHTEQAKENRRIKSLERHGVEHPFQAKHVVDKIKKSLDNSKNDMRIGSERWKEMMKEKYGVENISQVDEIKEIKRQTYLEKYGVENPAQIDVGITNYNEYMDIENFLKSTDKTLCEIGEYFNVSVGIIRQKIYKYKVENNFEDFHTLSLKEAEFLHELSKYLDIKEVDYEFGNRKLLNGKEIDFLFKDINLAVEISPTYTHNSEFEWAGEGKGLSEDYHEDKFITTLERGIKLITVFDWHRHDNIAKLVANELKKERLKILNPEITLTNNMNEEIKEFIKENELISNSSLEGNLVSVMKQNNEVISVCIYNKNENEYEIINYVYNVNYDGTSLIKLHIGKLKNTEIVSMTTDNSLGEILKLEEIGFLKTKKIDPKLNYYNISSGIHVYPKDVSKTEKKEKHFLSIYDCGHTKWTLI